MNPADPALRQGLLQRFLARLRFPQLFVVFAVLLAFDLIVPDFVPFIDELLLGLATALFASWKSRRRGAEPPPPPIKNVTPPGA
ncbi:MAG TPA: DUF6116 family protein [Thermoanaerobaculia bacterium]|nr:DUF6116 family protein [Thermoanaerobaculia bacterium]